MIPDSVKNIGIDAFETTSTICCNENSYAEAWSNQNGYTCVLLDRNVLSLPEQLTQISSEAFSGLSAATAVRIPASVASISDDAFDGSNIIILAPSGSYAITWAQEHSFDYIIE